MVLSLAASQHGQSHTKKLSFIDVRKAYFHAEVKRPLFVALPPEALEPHEVGKVCGKLNFSLYGTRDAASNWEQAYSDFLVGIGFRQGLTSPCIFRHPQRDIVTVVHGDGFTSLAQEQDLVWLNS